MRLEISVSEMARLLAPPDRKINYLMAMIRAYCDESYDAKQRLFVIAGYLANENQWKSLSRKCRPLLKPLRQFGVEAFHASDCESCVGDFKKVPKDDCIKLKIAITSATAQHKLHGFCAAIFIQDYRQAASLSPLAEKLFAPKEYFLAFQTLVGAMCVYVKKRKPSHQIAFIFDRQEEVGGRAKILYDEMRKSEPEYARYMGPLSYADKAQFIPLQVADNLAYEGMKTLLNLKYDPSRPPRKAMGVLVGQLEKFQVLNSDGLQRIVTKLTENPNLMTTL